MLAELANKAIEGKLKQFPLTHDDTMALLNLITAYERLTKKKFVSTHGFSDEETVDEIQETQGKLSEDLNEALNFDAMYDIVEKPKEVGED